MKASILDLRRRMREILKALDKNEQITLTYRGREKAKIIPFGLSQNADFRKHRAFGLWKDRKDLADVAKVVRKMRKGRFDAV